jgi:lipopolysaccharide transport system permease protein
MQVSEQEVRSELVQERGNTVSAVCIEPSRGLLHLDLQELWKYRELMYFLIWRDIKVRYKQTVIGAAWAILQPLMTVAIFILVFQIVANVPSDGVPYPLFALTAIIPWNFFSGGLTRSSLSVVAQSNLISKVYFPRLLIPISATVSGIVDFGLSLVILTAMMAWYGVAPTWGIVTLPLFLLLACFTALAVGLWLAALNVRYRDIGHTVPFLVQLWTFACPIAYPISRIPERIRLVYSLNPMVGVIEGFRWALLGNKSPDMFVIAISAAVVMGLLAGGIVYFKRMERTFADVV